MSGLPMSGPPYPPQPAYGIPTMPPYGAGVDPVTGQLMSNKSKVTAGLLQLLLGAVFTLGGIGRLYAGNVGLGVAQLVATVIAWISFWCGFALILPWFVTFGCWVWFVADGIVILVGRPADGQGRLLRG